MKILPVATMLLACPMFVGCGSEDSTAKKNGATPAANMDTAEATVRSIKEGLESGRPVVAWNALPPKYQSDVNEVVQTFATNMDQELWKQVTDTLGGIVAVLTDKQEFILNHPDIAASPDAAKTKETLPQVAAMLKTIHEHTSDLEKLKTFDGGAFLDGPGSSIASQAIALSKLAPQTGPTGGSPFDRLKNAEVSTVTEDADTATLKMTYADGTSEDSVFVKVDGKWLPQDMVTGWDQSIADAKAGLAELPGKINEIRPMVVMGTTMLSGPLQQMQAAETQEEFNNVVSGLKPLLGQALMMGAMGAGGGPPPGFSPGGPGAAPPTEQSPGQAPDGNNE